MYTEKMVNDLQAIGSFTFERAEQFAQENGLSVRSVISKIKHLGLPYTPKQRSPKQTITKAQVVKAIQNRLHTEKLDSLVNAKMEDLLVLASLL